MSTLPSTDFVNPPKNILELLEASPREFDLTDISRRMSNSPGYLYRNHEDPSKICILKCHNSSFKWDVNAELKFFQSVYGPDSAYLGESLVINGSLYEKFMTMAYLGETLAKWEPTGLSAWVLLLAKLLEKVQAIHRLGFLHLDIKPENIGVLGDEPYPFDFGNSLYHESAKTDRTNKTSLWFKPSLMGIFKPQIHTERTDFFGIGMTSLIKFLGFQLHRYNVLLYGETTTSTHFITRDRITRDFQRIPTIRYTLQTKYGEDFDLRTATEEKIKVIDEQTQVIKSYFQGVIDLKLSKYPELHSDDRRTLLGLFLDLLSPNPLAPKILEETLSTYVAFLKALHSLLNTFVPRDLGELEEKSIPDEGYESDGMIHPPQTKEEGIGSEFAELFLKAQRAPAGRTPDPGLS